MCVAVGTASLPASARLLALPARSPPARPLPPPPYPPDSPLLTSHAYLFGRYETREGPRGLLTAPPRRLETRGETRGATAVATLFPWAVLSRCGPSTASVRREWPQ